MKTKGEGSGSTFPSNSGKTPGIYMAPLPPPNKEERNIARGSGLLDFYRAVGTKAKHSEMKMV